jgi:hypothetical protein
MLTAGQRGVIAALAKQGIPITRENYIAFDYGDEVPDPWTAEDEAELPDILQEGYDGGGGREDDALQKYNEHHDERGRFASSDGGASPKR